MLSNSSNNSSNNNRDNRVRIRILVVLVEVEVVSWFGLVFELIRVQVWYGKRYGVRVWTMTKGPTSNLRAYVLRFKHFNDQYRLGPTFKLFDVH